MLKHIDVTEAPITESSPERFRNARIERNRDETHRRINSIVRTDAPTPQTEEEKKAAEKAKADAEAKAKAEAEVKTKAAEDAANATPTKASSNTRLLNGDAPAASGHKPEPKNFARNATIGLGATTAAMATLSPSFIAQIPLIGKIPYLPQAAATLQAGINNIITPLGLGTGVNATNAALASAPTWLGSALGTGIAIPAGLWGLGFLKNFAMGETKDGLGFGNISEAARTIVGLPFKTYEKAIDARIWAGKKVQGAWSIAITPIRGAFDIGKNIAQGTWDGAAAATHAALKPTFYGGGGLAIGTVLATMAAPATGGASYFSLPLLGYATGNMLRNSGALGGGSLASSNAR